MADFLVAILYFLWVVIFGLILGFIAYNIRSKIDKNKEQTRLKKIRKWVIFYEYQLMGKDFSGKGWRSLITENRESLNIAYEADNISKYLLQEYPDKTEDWSNWKILITKIQEIT